MSSSQPIPPPGFTPQAQPPTSNQQPSNTFNPTDVEKSFSAVSSLNLEGYPSNPKQNAPAFGFFQPLANAWSSFHKHRANLALPNPGTIEHLQREVKMTQLTYHFTEGARADLTKTISINPLFNFTHSFSLGQKESPPSWNFNGTFGDEKHFLQGGLDDQLNVNLRAHKRLAEGHVVKAQGQLGSSGSQSLLQLEHDYTGIDHSINLKALNPSPIDFTGIYIGSYLQSLTKNFSLGIEGIFQRPEGGLTEATLGYSAKWANDNRDSIATIQMQGQGVIQATYWQKIGEKVDLAADLQAILGQRRDAVATVGAKWDFKMATYRAQIDSSLKVSSMLETHLAPTFSFSVGGEIDHLKGGAARFGMGVQFETPTPELQEAAENQAKVGIQVTPPRVPM